MRVTYHAGERLLQRVFQFATYTKKQIHDAVQLIERDVRDVEYRNKKRFILPSFPDFCAVMAEDALVTVILKRHNRR